MFERKNQKVISRQKFITRQMKFSVYASLILLLSLAMGVIGYSATEQLSFTDALLNASMILTGMGPVNPMTNESSKLFASFYALYSGVAFLSVIGIFSAPIVHRFMHKLHLEE
jgi:CDP-diglyceride synthetase